MPPTAAEIEYKVAGVYITTNGTTGNIEGNRFRQVDPLQNGGEFRRVLTTTVSGCTAERAFRDHGTRLDELAGRRDDP